jgi:radical SAM protein with 4Fe4S-binding SPASM domain
MFQLLKIALAFWSGKTRLTYPPLKAWVEVTNACNLACPECLNASLPVVSKKHLSSDEFVQILNKLPEGTREINLFHRGEPFLNPAMDDLIRLAKGRGKFVRIYTNGTLLEGPEAAARLLEAGPDMIAFSIVHPLSEKNVSKEGLFRALANMETLLRERSRKRLAKPFIKFEIISLGLEKDFEAKADLMKNYSLADIDAIAFRNPHNWGGCLFVPGSRDTNRKPNQCTFPWYSIVIFSDGTVVPCPQDFYGKLALGNIFRDSFESLWNGPAMTALREKHVRRMESEDEICWHCDRIWRRTFLKVPLEHARIFFEKSVESFRLRSG